MRHEDHVHRLDRGAVLARELDGGRDHLLADDPELHRHEDAPEVRHVVEAARSSGAITRSVRPSPCERRTTT